MYLWAHLCFKMVINYFFYHYCGSEIKTGTGSLLCVIVHHKVMHHTRKVATQHCIWL